MSNIIDQILKLRNLGKGSANENEAMAAMRAADKLINKHRITESMLDEADPSKKQTAKQDEFVLYESGRITKWKSDLAVILSKHYDCAIFNDASRATGRLVSRYRLVGVPSDMEIVRYMFSWLVNEINTLGGIVARGQGKIYAASYAEGVVRGINLQLDLAKEDQVIEAEHTGQTSALVKLDERAEEAEKTLRIIHPMLKRSHATTKRRVNVTAMNHGIRDGKQIHLNKGLPDGNGTSS